MSESATQENATEESITRCICGFTHDDGYMIWCDGCNVWQHLSCMELDPSSLPEVYYCEICQPRPVNSDRAKQIQRRYHTSDTSGSGDDAGIPSNRMTHRSFSNETPTPSKVESSSSLHTFHKKHTRRHKHHYSSSQIPTPPPTDTNSTPAKLLKHSKPFRPYPRRNSNNMECEQQDSESTLAEEVSALWHSSAKHYSSNELRETHVLSESVQNAVSRLCAMPEQNPQTVFTSGEGRGGSTAPRPVGCNLQLVERKRKGVITIISTQPEQLIVELKGNVLDGETLSQTEGIHPSNLKDSLTPFILTHKGLGKHSVYIDSRAYDNKARHVRRSCEPNAIVRHYIVDSHLKFGIFGEREISKGHEVTIPYDSPVQQCDYLVECGCGFRSARCPARAHNLRLKKRLAQLQLEREERATPDTTIKMESVCSVPTEDDMSPLLIPPRKRKRHRIESDSIPNLPHSTATTPVQESAGGAKKSREDRKLEGVLKLIEKMEKQPSHPYPQRKSSSQEEPPVFSPSAGVPAGPSFKQRRISGLEKRAKRHNSHKKSGSFSEEEGGGVSSHRTPEVKVGGLSSSPSPPSVFEKTPLKKLLLHQWGEEVRGMEAERKREVLLPDIPDQVSHRLDFPPHPFSDVGEYHFSKWGYTLTPDTSLYKFRGAPKKHCTSNLPPPTAPPAAPATQEAGEGAERESQGEQEDGEWVKTLPIKKQLVYLFNQREQQRLRSEREREREEEEEEARERKRRLEAERDRMEETQEGEERSEEAEGAAQRAHQMDAASDISVESEKLASSDAEAEADDVIPADSPPLVHSTTSDQPIVPTDTDTEYLSPVPVEYSPSPPHSPDPVSPLSAASSSTLSPKIPHTPSPDPPPPEEETPDHTVLLSPPGHVPRMDSCISQVSSTLDSPQHTHKSLVPDYVSPSSSSSTPYVTGGSLQTPHTETLSPPAQLVTQDISPAEELVPPIPPLPAPPRKLTLQPQHPSNPRQSSEFAKASSLDSDMGSRHTPDPYRRSAPYSHLNPRFDPFYPSSRNSSSPELRLIASKALQDLHRPDSSPFQVISPLTTSSPAHRPIDTSIDFPARLESPSMDTDTPITPVESITPLSESCPRADGSNISASGKRVVTLEEYRKRKEQTRASSSSSQLLSHVQSPSDSGTPPPLLCERERVRGNSSAGLSEPPFWEESRRDKDRRLERYQHSWDTHARHHAKESSHRHRERHRDKHRGRGHRERERERYEDRRLYHQHQHRENRRRTSSDAYEETRVRYSQPLPAPHPVAIEPVSPEDTQQTETGVFYDRRYSTPLPLPSDPSHIITLSVLMGHTSEQNN